MLILDTSALQMQMNGMIIVAFFYLFNRSSGLFRVCLFDSIWIRFFIRIQYTIVVILQIFNKFVGIFILLRNSMYVMCAT